MTLIVASREFSSALEYKQGTIFAPTNAAIDEYRKAYPNDLNNFTLLYHYSKTEQINWTMRTLLHIYQF